MSHFKAIFKAFKSTHPSKSEIEQIVVVKAPYMKDAKVLAKEELKFLDPQNYDKYRNPEITSIPDDEAQQIVSEYFSRKEAFGQADIEDAEITDHQEREYKVVIAQFDIIEPHSVRIGITNTAGEREAPLYRCSYSLVDRVKEATCFGSLFKFQDKTFTKVANAALWAIGKSIDGINEFMDGIIDEKAAATSVNILKGFCDEMEFEFDRRVRGEDYITHTELFGGEDELTTTDGSDSLDTGSAGGDTAGSGGNDEPLSYGEYILSSVEPQTNDEYLRAVARILVSAGDDTHKELSKEQYEESADKLEAVFKEFEEDWAPEHGASGINRPLTYKNLNNIEWDSGAEALKTLLNIRCVRSMLRENVVYSVDEKDAPSDADLMLILDAVMAHPSWSKVPADFDAKVSENFHTIKVEYEQINAKHIAAHITGMHDILPLYDLGRCEEIAGFYHQEDENNEQDTARQDLECNPNVNDASGDFDNNDFGVNGLSVGDVENDLQEIENANSEAQILTGDCITSCVVGYERDEHRDIHAPNVATGVKCNWCDESKAGLEIENDKEPIPHDISGHREWTTGSDSDIDVDSYDEIRTYSGICDQAAQFGPVSLETAIYHANSLLGDYGNDWVLCDVETEILRGATNHHADTIVFATANFEYSRSDRIVKFSVAASCGMSSRFAQELENEMITSALKKVGFNIV